MRTPGEDEELVAGFLFSERVISTADDLDVVARYRAPDGDPDSGNVMNVLLKGDPRVARELLRRNFVASSSCGLCGKVTIDAIRASLPPVESDVVVPRRPVPEARAGHERGPADLREDRGAARGGALRCRRPLDRAARGHRAPQRRGQGHRPHGAGPAAPARSAHPDGQRPRQLRDHAEGPDGEDPRGRGGVGSVQPGRADGHRRRHDAGGVRAAGRLQYLRRRPSRGDAGTPREARSANAPTLTSPGGAERCRR